MGEGLALDAAWLFAAFLVLLVIGAAGIAARRFLLERSGANVECGLRQGRGSWRLGVASYQLDEFCWFGVFGISMRPEETFSRRDLAVVSRRQPTEAEVSILGPGRIVVECQLGEAGAPGAAGHTGAPGTAGQSDAAGQVSGPGDGEAGRVGGPGDGEGGQARGGGADRDVELALAESALTGLLAWLEAAPPGSHLDLAL